ncbi:MAG: fumarylacetoacetate hydrolase family protein [Rhizorhabdus sp.]|nr:fumarylacetoacetate hydrolase family protein [Rhizorhabdus sp.]
MKLVSFFSGTETRLGALVAGGVLDLAKAGARLGQPLPVSMQELIEAGPATWDRARLVIASRPDEDVVAGPALGAPLPRPVRLRDFNLFLEHMEKGLALIGKTMSPAFKEQVIYYNADHLHIFGPDVEVPFPRAATWIDYELEWACIIGRAGSNISRADAKDHIFGYCIFNDWSERGTQFPFMEANLGPGIGKDFANGLGPCIVTTDEIDDPYALRMTAHVNGELWSEGTTGSMFWRFEDAIAQHSIDRSFAAGEILGSGTVLNGCGFELSRRLAFGDVVRLEIEGIGVLENRVVSA